MRRHSKIPRIRFGTDQYTGGNGGDYPASELSSADASGNLDTNGNGNVLVSFRGRLMTECQKKELINEEQSLVDSEKQSTEQLFRDRAGFVRNVADSL